MPETIEQIAGEIRERVARIESRIVQLGDHVGANLRSKQRISINRQPMRSYSMPWVEIDALDVSVSRILTELRQAGIKANQNISVVWDGRLVFTLYLKD